MAKPKSKGKAKSKGKSKGKSTPSTPTAESQSRPPKSTLRTPATITEFRRLGHAFLAGSKFKTNEVVYVVGSTTEPLRRIQETFGTLEEAEAAIIRPVDQRRGWSTDEMNSRVIYQVTVPDVAALSEIWPCVHEYTDFCSGGDSAFRSATLGDIASVEVHITLKTGESHVFHPGGVPDAVFISRGAYEVFAFPAYQSAFGPQYVEALRKALFGEAAPRR